jgi:uncharacterized membrane protein
MMFLPSYKARLQWAGLFVPALTALSAGAAPANAPVESAYPAAPVRAAEYSVINLGPDASMTALNQRGQAAFGNPASDAPFNGFFDGSRVYTLGSFGRSFTYLTGLNNRGVVIGSAQDPFSDRQAFSWTVAGGMRLLPGTAADAFAINDCNQVAGAVDVSGQRPPYTRALRWNPDGTMTPLGPLPATFSAAWTINERGMTAGAADDERRYLRATVWDAAGRATDLGALGGPGSTATHINARGQVLGTAYRDRGAIGFLWSRQSGMVQIGPDAGSRDVSALNDNGEVAGNNQVEDDVPGLHHSPFIWSIRRGMRPLPLAGAPYGRVDALNNRREMVGYVERTAAEWRSRRAVYWKDVANPVDLNTRLYRAPAGLVLYSASAINDNGSILANSNAGLVLLRPGRAGTAAPVLGPIAGATEDDAVTSGDTVDFIVSFVDSAVAESHVASASVDDGCPQPMPSLRERRGLGDVSLRHTFCRPGFATVKVKVTDRAGNATQVQRRLFVLDRSVATLVGQGTLAQAGKSSARYGKVPLRFAVWAPLDANAAAASRASAAPLVTVSGPFHFNAEVVGKPERDGQSVRLGGTGRLDGRPGYRFLVEASPGRAQRGGADRLRVRISHTDAATKAELVDFDNGIAAAPAAAPNSAIMVAPPAAQAPAQTPANAADGTLVTQGGLRLAE